MVRQLTIDITFLGTSYVWPFLNEKLPNFVLNTWPNSCIELATENYKMYLADFLITNSKYVACLYIPVLILQLFANISAASSVPVSISLFGYLLYVSIWMLFSRLLNHAAGEELRIRRHARGVPFLRWITSVLSFVVLVIATSGKRAVALNLELGSLDGRNWFFTTATIYFITSWIAPRLESFIRLIGTHVVCELYYHTRSSFLAKFIPDDYAQIDRRILREPSKYGWFIAPFSFWLALLATVLDWTPGVTTVWRVFILWVAYYAIQTGEYLDPDRIFSRWASRIFKAMSLTGVTPEIAQAYSFFETLDTISRLISLALVLVIVLTLGEEVFGWPSKFAKLIFIDNPLVRGLLAIFLIVSVALFLTLIWILTAVKNLLIYTASFTSTTILTICNFYVLSGMALGLILSVPFSFSPLPWWITTAAYIAVIKEVYAFQGIEFALLPYITKFALPSLAIFCSWVRKLVRVCL